MLNTVFYYNEEDENSISYYTNMKNEAVKNGYTLKEVEPTEIEIIEEYEDPVTVEETTPREIEEFVFDEKTNEEKIIKRTEYIKEQKINYETKTRKVKKEVRQFKVVLRNQKTKEQIIEELKEVRKSYLSETDIMVSAPDYPITEQEKELVLQYREYLRHIPENKGYPYDAEGNVVHIMTFEEWKQ